MDHEVTGGEEMHSALLLLVEAVGWVETRGPSVRTAVSILVVKSYKELWCLSKSLMHLDCFGEFV